MAIVWEEDRGWLLAVFAHRSFNEGEWLLAKEHNVNADVEFFFTFEPLKLCYEISTDWFI